MLITGIYKRRPLLLFPVLTNCKGRRNPRGTTRGSVTSAQPEATTLTEQTERGAPVHGAPALCKYVCNLRNGLSARVNDALIIICPLSRPYTVARCAVGSHPPHLNLPLALPLAAAGSALSCNLLSVHFSGHVGRFGHRVSCRRIRTRQLSQLLGG